MNAFFITAPHQIEQRDVPLPAPGPGEALVRVRLVGVCGSDLHAYEGSQPFFQYPQIGGHEVVGEVVEVSAEASPVPAIPNRTQERAPRVGDRVTLDPSLPCGHCYPCRNGRYNCCANLRVMGVHAPGAMAEFFTAPTACLHVVPEGMSDELAVLAEPVSIGVEATNRSRLQAGENCLIIGAGTIGLCVLMVARVASRSDAGTRIALSDLCQGRLELAQELGADLTLNPAHGDIAPALLDFTGGDGPAVVFEAVGHPATVAQAGELVAAAGRVVQIGLCSEPICFPGNLFVKKELDWLGSRLHGGTLPEAVRLLAEDIINPLPLITHRMRLAQAEEALRLMAERPEEVVKVVLKP
jgi:L-gulonate 5-dehydrogenase